MSRLQDLFDRADQSPWLAAATHACLRSDRLARWVEAGVRGVSAAEGLFDPASFDTDDLDGRLASLTTGHLGVDDVLWELTIGDVSEALALLKPLYQRSRGRDGFVTIRVPTRLADDSEGIVASARACHVQLDQPNLLVGVPATDVGIIALRQITSEGLGTNAMTVLSVQRYEQVIGAYLSGLEVCPGDLSGVHSVASFPLQQLDWLVDAELERHASPTASALRRQGAKAFAQVAYRLFRQCFSGPRWDALSRRGANPQRPVWVSARAETHLPDTYYVDDLIGGGTISAMPNDVLAAFADHGEVTATLQPGVGDATEVFQHLRGFGVDLGVVSPELEERALRVYRDRYQATLAALADRIASVSN